MTMTLAQILEEIEETDAWKVRAACASAAERAAPLFRRMGRTESRPVFEASLDAVWAAVDSGRIAKVKGALRRLPEANADDPHSPDYYAGLALVVLFHSIDFAATSDVQNAQNCVEEIASLCDDIDTTLSSAPGQTFRYDPKNPPPPGEIEMKELRAQTEILELLRAVEEPEPAFLESLRQRAREHAAIYEAVAPHLADS